MELNDDTLIKGLRIFWEEASDGNIISEEWYPAADQSYLTMKRESSYILQGGYFPQKYNSLTLVNVCKIELILLNT